MRILLPTIIFMILFSSCATQKLYVTTPSLPDRLGIHVVNNSNVGKGDWEYFSHATDSFIVAYNSGNNAVELYLSEVDSNSIHIDFQSNEFVTKQDQKTGVLVTTAGIITPIIMLATGLPIIVAFWYNPKNKTLLSNSMSWDLDKTRNVISRSIITKHNFDSYEEQKVKQSNAYYDLLFNTIDNINIRVEAQVPYTSLVYPDLMILNNGKQYYCKITNSDNEKVYFTIEQNSKVIDTFIYRESIKNIVTTSDLL